MADLLLAHPRARGAVTRRPAEAAAPTIGFRADIEGLRALAVLAVILYHARLPGLTGGFVGVDIFFAISGYLITSLLVAEFRRTGGIDLLGFWARRVRRLLPASATVLAVTLAASALLLSATELAEVARTALAAALYASNIYFLAGSRDYFAPRSEDNPLLHSWSLAVEEQFYLLWPILILLLFTRTAAGLGSPRRALIALGLLSLASFALCVALTRIEQPWAFYAMPARMWEFGLGGIAALAFARGSLSGRGARLTPARCDALGWAGLALIAASCLLIGQSSAFPGVVALAPVLGSLAVLVAGALHPGCGVARLLSLAPAQWIGQRSYAIYLWHWPVLVLAEAALPTFTLTERLAGVGLSVMLAALSYHWIENPVRYSRLLAARPATTLRLGVAATAATALVSLWVWQGPAQRPPTAEAQRLAQIGAERPAVYPADCWPTEESLELRECVFGDPRSARTVVLFGDSHAGHWFPALQRIAERKRWRFVTLLKSQCPTAGVASWNARLKRRYRECETWRRAALARIVALRPHAVVTSNSMAYEVKRGGQWLPVRGSGTFAWSAGLQRTARHLDRAGIATIVIRDNPRAQRDTLACLGRLAQHAWMDPARCDLSRAAALSDGLAAAERGALAGVPRAAYLDFTGRFCGMHSCPARIGSLVLYRDSNHLTVEAAHALTPALGAALEAAGL